MFTTLFSRQDSSKKRLRFIEEYEGTKKDLTEALKKTAVVKPRRKLEKNVLKLDSKESLENFFGLTEEQTKTISVRSEINDKQEEKPSVNSRPQTPPRSPIRSPNKKTYDKVKRKFPLVSC